MINVAWFLDLILHGIGKSVCVLDKFDFDGFENSRLMAQGSGVAF